MTQNYIYLGSYHGHSIAVSDEAYVQIQDLIETGKICRECSSHYDEHNPEMARNVCLTCFLKDSNRSGLNYVGGYDYTSDGSHYTYRYETLIDTKGYLYKISPDLSQDREQRDEALTMRHWGFHVPTQVIRDGEVTILHDSEWSFFGDIHNSVIVARNHHRQLNDSKTFVFLLYKDQDPRELNKRKGDARSLFIEARKRLEATKDEKGHYRGLDGHEFYHAPEDYNCYDYIAQIEMDCIEAKKVQTEESVRISPMRAKQPPREKKEAPSLSGSDWAKVAWENMRPWEKALWKDALEEEGKV